MARLEALLRHLESSGKGAAAIALDEGPVFMLARLHAIGHESLRERWFEPWWRGMFARCGRQIDLIVWVDASDPVLVDRIRTREQTHPLKESSDEAMSTFLKRYRKSYDHVISGLMTAGGPKLVCLNTERESAEQLSCRVLAALEEDLCP